MIGKQNATDLYVDMSVIHLSHQVATPLSLQPRPQTPFDISIKMMLRPRAVQSGWAWLIWWYTRPCNLCIYKENSFDRIFL